MLSLGRVLGTTLATIPEDVPYLRAEPALVEHWRRELNAVAGPGELKVGIAWQGSPGHAKDHYRSVPLTRFAPLAALPGVRLVSLQKGAGSEQLAALGGLFPVVDLGERLDASGAFLDTAALMQGLDLVVTIDSALAHLAGALGAPVWVALSFVADWRWLLDREDSPWYPTMRLFRQRRPGDWDDVFARLAAALAERLARRGAPAPLRVRLSPGELLDRLARLESQDNAEGGAELARLRAVQARALPASAALAELLDELRAVHEALRRLEAARRDCARNGDAGAQAGELARDTTRNHERRLLLMRQIDSLASEGRQPPASAATRGADAPVIRAERQER
jgi:hypothetical protein